MKHLTFCALFVVLLAGCNRWRVETPDAKDITVSSKIDNDAILTANEPFILEGTASAGSFLVVRFGDFQKDVRVNSKGHWNVKLPKMPAGGPYLLHVAGAELKTFKNIIIAKK